MKIHIIQSKSELLNWENIFPQLSKVHECNALETMSKENTKVSHNLNFMWKACQQFQHIN